MWWDRTQKKAIHACEEKQKNVVICTISVFIEHIKCSCKNKKGNLVAASHNRVVYAGL